MLTEAFASSCPSEALTISSRRTIGRAIPAAVVLLLLTISSAFGNLQSAPDNRAGPGQPLGVPPFAPQAGSEPRLHTIEGIVTDTAGAALADVVVAFRCSGRVAASTRSNFEGYFNISGTGVDPCLLEASLADYVPLAVVHNDESWGELILSISPGTVQVYVVDGFTGAPARDVEIGVALVDGGVLTAEGSTDLNGRASGLVTPGEYWVRARGGGYATRWERITVPPNGFVPVNFRMSLIVEGTVVSLNTGNPIPNAWVTIYRIGGPSGPGSGLSRRLEAEEAAGGSVALPELPSTIDGEMVCYTLTDEYGYFRFDAPRAGEYRAVAEADGWYAWPETTDTGNLTASEPEVLFQLRLSRLRQRTPVVPPLGIDIPALSMRAPIVTLGVESDGTMEAPDDPDTVGWYSEGPGVGEPGNAIFAGHVDWGGRLRTFGLLYRLGAGDVVNITAASGERMSYRVEWAFMVDADSPVDEIFRQGTREEITLITCGGEFDRTIRQYRGRLIVRAVRAA